MRHVLPPEAHFGLGGARRPVGNLTVTWRTVRAATFAAPTPGTRLTIIRKAT